MSDRFAWDPLGIREVLADLGFDVDLSDAWSGGVVRARRDRGDRVCLLVLDAAGRLRAEWTATIDETGRAAEGGGTPLRVVATTQRLVTVTGTVAAAPDLAATVAVLDEIAAADMPPPPEWSGPDGPPP